MNRPLAFICLVALAPLGTGCVAANDTSVEAMYVCAPADDAAACAPSSGECDRYLTGYADLWMRLDDGAGGFYPNGLWFFMQVANNRPPNPDEGVGQLNSANARITDYVLSYEGPGFSTEDYTYSTVTVTVPAESTATPFVALLPEEISAGLGALIPDGETWPIDVYVRFKGHFLDGKEFETGKFKVKTYMTDANFPGYTCPNATDVITAVCPNEGQTSSWTCEEQEEPPLP